jgi:hypothetical protein
MWYPMCPQESLSSALFDAIIARRQGVAGLLLGHGAPVDFTLVGCHAMASGSSRLGIAVSQLLVGAVHDALQARDAMTALYIACEKGLRAVTLSLLARGASVQQRTTGGFTPLHAVASHSGDTLIAATLLQHGAIINETAVRSVSCCSWPGHPRPRRHGVPVTSTHLCSTVGP